MDDPSSGDPRRRRKSAAERRAQKLRSEGRLVARLLKAFSDIEHHRGGANSRLGSALWSTLRGEPRAAHENDSVGVDNKVHEEAIISTAVSDIKNEVVANAPSPAPSPAPTPAPPPAPAPTPSPAPQVEFHREECQRERQVPAGEGQQEQHNEVQHSEDEQEVLESHVPATKFIHEDIHGDFRALPAAFWCALHGNFAARSSPSPSSFSSLQLAMLEHIAGARTQVADERWPPTLVQKRIVDYLGQVSSGISAPSMMDEPTMGAIMGSFQARYTELLHEWYAAMDCQY
jgi:hypothetical protein